jgi:hypothetical protein
MVGVEALEPRVMLSTTMMMIPMCDTGDDGSGDGSDSSSPPADTQPVDTQPADTQPADTQPVDTQPTDSSGGGDGSGDDGSGDAGLDDGGVEDFPPPPVDVTPLPPGRPARVTLQMATPTSVFLSWQEPSQDADSFLIERLGPTGGWKKIATVDGGTRHFTNKGLTPGATYSYDIVAENDGGDSDESNAVTTMIAVDADPTVIGEFGKLPGGGASVPLSFFDADGTKVTLTMSGPGIGEVHLNGGAYTLTLAGTTMNSQVHIVTAKSRTAGDDGRFALAGISVASGLGSLSAGTTDVTGAVNVVGAAGSLTLGNFSNGSVDVGNAGARAGSLVSLNLGQVGDVDVHAALGIKTLTAQKWGSGDIVASSVGTLSITGKSVVGNFGANLTLKDATGVKKTLGKATIAGGVVGGQWAVTGMIGSLTVRGMVSDAGIRATAGIGTVTVGGMDHAEIFAGIAAGVMGLPSAGADFVGTAPIGTVKIVGLRGVAALTDSDVAASAMGSVTMPTAAGAVVDVDQSGRFGFATLVGDVKKYRGPASVGNFVAGLDSAVG